MIPPTQTILAETEAEAEEDVQLSAISSTSSTETIVFGEHTIQKGKLRAEENADMEVDEVHLQILPLPNAPNPPESIALEPRTVISASTSRASSSSPPPLYTPASASSNNDSPPSPTNAIAASPAVPAISTTEMRSDSSESRPTEDDVMDIDTQTTHTLPSVSSQDSDIVLLEPPSLGTQHSEGRVEDEFIPAADDIRVVATLTTHIVSSESSQSQDSDVLLVDQQSLKIPAEEKEEDESSPPIDRTHVAFTLSTHILPSAPSQDSDIVLLETPPTHTPHRLGEKEEEEEKKIKSVPPIGSQHVTSVGLSGEREMVIVSRSGESNDMALTTVSVSVSKPLSQASESSGRLSVEEGVVHNPRDQIRLASPSSSHSPSASSVSVQPSSEQLEPSSDSTNTTTIVSSPSHHSAPLPFRSPLLPSTPIANPTETQPLCQPAPETIPTSSPPAPIPVIESKPSVDTADTSMWHDEDFDLAVEDSPVESSTPLPPLIPASSSRSTWKSDGHMYGDYTMHTSTHHFQPQPQAPSYFPSRKQDETIQPKQEVTPPPVVLKVCATLQAEGKKLKKVRYEVDDETYVCAQRWVNRWVHFE